MAKIIVGAIISHVLHELIKLFGQTIHLQRETTFVSTLSLAQSDALVQSELMTQRSPCQFSERES